MSTTRKIRTAARTYRRTCRTVTAAMVAVVAVFTGSACQPDPLLIDTPATTTAAPSTSAPCRSVVIDAPTIENLITAGHAVAYSPVAGGGLWSVDGVTVGQSSAEDTFTLTTACLPPALADAVEEAQP